MADSMVCPICRDIPEVDKSACPGCHGLGYIGCHDAPPPPPARVQFVAAAFDGGSGTLYALDTFGRIWRQDRRETFPAWHLIESPMEPA